MKRQEIDRLRLSPEVAWEAHFHELVAFKRAYGHCRVVRHRRQHRALGGWVSRQRSIAKRGLLSKEKLRRLEAIGFDWSPVDSYWERQFGALAKFRRAHGHCKVPACWPANPALSRWVSVQRMLWAAGRLRADRRRRLKQIGLRRNDWEQRWQRQFRQLREFRRRFGHCQVPAQWGDNPSLSNWVARQRKLRNEGRLKAGRRCRLMAIGFAWKGRNRKSYENKELWNASYAALARYQRAHGHCLALASRPGTWWLSQWATQQREARLRGVLSEERRRKLDALGFAWDGEQANWDARWERRFDQLLAFRRRFGHCRVPAGWSENTPLSAWVQIQRVRKKQGKLRAERMRRLNAIGFMWKSPLKQHADPEARWNEMLAALVAYKKTHGECVVPEGHPHTAQLNRWVKGQREAGHHGRLREDRRQRLDALGFVWDASKVRHERQWERRFADLLEFKRRFGHCCVPKGFSEDPALGRWVYSQRRFRQQGKLNPRCVQRLNEIGFQWEGSAPIIERAKEILRNLEEAELTPEGQPKIAQHEHGRGKGKGGRGKGKAGAKTAKVSEPLPQMYLFGEKTK